MEMPRKFQDLRGFLIIPFEEENFYNWLVCAAHTP